MMDSDNSLLEEERIRSPRVDLLNIRSFMEEHYHEPLSVDQLAKLANISPKYFVDLFKKTYGQSAIDYLTNLRINRAKRYLTESDLRLREIALKVGYSDEFYFSRKFKKEVGVSPSAFIKNPRRRIAAYSPAIMGQLLALNLIPAAAPLDSKWTPYYYNVYQNEIKLHMSYGEENSGTELNKLITARPDAIVAGDVLLEEEKQKLAGIAPTLFVPAKQTSWQEQLHQIALFVGRDRQAKAWIEDYNRKAAFAKQKMEEAVGKETFAVIRINGNGLHMYCNRAIHDVLYEDLRLNPAYKGEKLYNKEISLKQLEEINPDHLLLLVCPERASRTYWLTLQHQVEWRKLKAVEKGSSYLIPSDPWCEYSAFAINRMLDEMLLLFTGYCPNSYADKVHGSTRAHEI
ncbi:AraC family transcriptional regulator [Paenibacillus sp. FSL A5-0031]|uniref:AraC family transcriptional regulator n=1 Tax=Paenibacillus sp. FSL A5-0031 TaxID=1920420 RepID=UPI00273EF9A4|nr:AraC family transcriptional regulator [Paenibacillus sp. FSL A5-0031]